MVSCWARRSSRCSIAHNVDTTVTRLLNCVGRIVRDGSGRDPLADAGVQRAYLAYEAADWLGGAAGGSGDGEQLTMEDDQ